MKTCSKCGEAKPESEFRARSGKNGALRSSCKSCQSTYAKQHYSRNVALYKGRARASNEKMRIDTKAVLSGYLADHPCVDCGESDPVVLEFDHVRGTKKFCVGVAAGQRYSVKRLLAEIEKCEVRCANCHRRRTSRLNGSWKVVPAK